jgi:CDP-4-dehydro-6-deoxyglucose reductase
MATVTLRSGQNFEAGPAESLLDAALRNGLSLPYSCRTGRCSTCKAMVVAGQTAPLLAETGLTEHERADGWILTCVRASTADLTLDVEDLAELQLATPRTLPCRIHAIEFLKNDVVRVVLRLPPQTAFEYRAGQYVEIIGPAGVRRSYSVANAPAPGAMLEFHIQRVHGGVMSDYWFEHAKVNDLLRLYGPLGTFVLRELAGQDLICLATGTGLAPIKAMLEELKTLPAHQLPRKTMVFWGVRKEADHYLKLQEQPGVEVIPVLSRAGDNWAGARGYVQDVLLARSADLSHATVYACGSDAMITGSRKRLLEAGLSERAFRSDAFVCSAKP